MKSRPCPGVCHTPACCAYRRNFRGRTRMGEQYHRAAITLAAMTGNIGLREGTRGPLLGNHTPFIPILLSWGHSWRFPKPVDQAAPDRKITLRNYTNWRSMASVHSSKLADAILRGKAVGIPRL